MTNADKKFKGIFGVYATEVWSKSYKKFSEWLDVDFAQHDIVEVVRCKDCKNSSLCAIEDEARDETFFCKWGERRD